MTHTVIPVGPMFLKTGTKLRGEADRLRWLAGKVAAPELVGFAEHDGREYMLTRALPGVNGEEAICDRPMDVVTSFARALKSLHALPIGDCPFDHSVRTQMALAGERIARGLVDESDFDDERSGRNAADIFRGLQPAPSERRALTHGDATLENAIFDDGRCSGFVDCDRFGVADPYHDLALAARSIAEHGAELVTRFFAAYGLADPDSSKLAFYRLLDEFF